MNIQIAPDPIPLMLEEGRFVTGAAILVEVGVLLPRSRSCEQGELGHNTAVDVCEWCNSIRSAVGPAAGIEHYATRRLFFDDSRGIEDITSPILER